MHESTTIPAADGYTVHLDSDRSHGHFQLNGQAIGGLWFTHNDDGQLALRDYDGVFQLPAQVAKALRDAGIAVDECFA